VLETLSTVLWSAAWLPNSVIMASK
jgi:hypothetical protein